jgi:ABC-type sulfate transport system substrate-binding protein
MVSSKDCGRNVLWTIYSYCPCIFVRKTTKIHSQDNRDLRKESVPKIFPNTKSMSVRYSMTVCVPASYTVRAGIVALQASGT